MFGLTDQLRTLRIPINIGIAGIGSIGKGMLLQARLTPGIRCVAVADVVIERAVAAAEQFGYNYQVVRSLGELHDAVFSGRLAVCADGDMLSDCEAIEVFIEATNSIADGGRHGISAIESNKHVVMMNYEADLMFGSLLMNKALERGLVYTVCDGDQPAAIKRLTDEVVFMGFKLVMAGNIKGYLDRYANPTSIIPEADKRNLDYRMCASYTDGTKLNIEMAVLANGLDLHTAVPGMYGPRIDDIYAVFDLFDFDKLWDGKRGFVDYVLGARPQGGVFVIGYTEERHQQDTLAWLPSRMGPGPFYVFYRPYHLCHFESMASVAEAALNRRPVLQPGFGFKANVYAYAKRDLHKGERLDGMGGYTCYGLIENCEENGSHPGLPICLAENAVMKCEMRQDAPILLQDVVHAPDDYAVFLYRQALTASGKPK